MEVSGQAVPLQDQAGMDEEERRQGQRRIRHPTGGVEDEAVAAELS